MGGLTMEWLLLLLLVPAVIVPVVLLFGFVGCGLDVVGSGPDPKTTKPTGLKATAVGTDRIKLEWVNNTVPTTFKVERRDAGGGFPVIDSNAASGFEDTGRNDGTDDTYRVRAVLAGVSYDSDPSDEATATTHPNAPSNLRLTPQEVDQIDLQWDHVTQSNKKINFSVEHRPKGGSFTQVYFGPDKTFSHKDSAALTAGSEHEYQVTAVVDGFDNSAPTPVSSTPAADSAKTWAVAFSAVLDTDQPPNGPSLGGYCLVQKISKALLTNSGTKVRITLRGHSTAQLTINRVYISQPDPAPGKDRWDSLPPGSPGGLTKVVDTDLGDPATVLGVIPSLHPDPTAATLGPVVYGLDSSKDLLVAFDISAAPGQGNVRSVLLPGTGTEHYYRAATEPPGQAARADRSPAAGLPPPGFTTGADRLYLVEQIEVL